MGVDAQMLVRTRRVFTPDKVRRLSGHLAAAFGSDSFWIWDDYKNEDSTIGRHALELIKEYHQDGEPIFPKPGETFIEVHIATRYYGKGYERGDLRLIMGVAEWLEARIPECDIYYGGDSSGICAEPFDAKARRELFSYFAKVGHEPYVGSFSSIFDRQQPPHCDFCLRDMLSTGGGGSKTFYYCSGCGKKTIFDGLTKTIQLVPKGKDFFDMWKG